MINSCSPCAGLVRIDAGFGAWRLADIINEFGPHASTENSVVEQAMDLARVIGTVVATRRDPAFEHVKMVVIQPLDSALKPSGDPIVALDALGRGRGDLVYIVRSGDAMFACKLPGYVPTDCAVGGLVDQATLDGLVAS